MKKTNLNNKKFRLLSVGLLASTTVLSVENPKKIVAQEANENESVSASSEEEVPVYSSSEEVALNNEVTTDSTVGNIEIDTTESSTIVSSESTEPSTDESSSTDDTTETTDSTDSSSTEPSHTTGSSSTTDTTSSSSSSTSTSSSGTTSTSSSTTTSSASKPKDTTKPSTNNNTNKNNNKTNSSNKTNNHSSGNNTGSNGNRPVQQNPYTSNYYSNSNESSNNLYIPNYSGSNILSGETQNYTVSPNLTTKAFIKEIGEDAREIAGENDLYASVMIAQAILESASGNSALASAPNYNLFGIKGSYNGASASFLTSEDNGSGEMFTIRSNFRKYPSYKESLGDYVKLLKGGTLSNDEYYSGTWKSNTSSYKDATKFLTGRYATDTSYASKLNALIDAYNLMEYDELKETDKKSETKDKVAVTKLDKKVEKEDKEKDEKIEYITHIVKQGESLRSISELYNISTLAILEKNQMDRRMLFIGQKLLIPKQEDQTEVVVSKVEAVDLSLEVASKISNAFSGKKSTKNDSKLAGKKDDKEKEYKVSASRKKSEATYKVKKDDSLASISKETGISIWSLKEWNNLDYYFLTEGQELVLAPSYDV